MGDEQTAASCDDAIELASVDPLADTPGNGIQVRPGAEFAALIEPAGLMQRPHRTEFHAFALFHGGSVTHTIDFTDYELKAGDLFWTRPGQIHRFCDPERYDATAVTLQRGFVSRATAAAVGRHIHGQPPVLRPDEQELAPLEESLAQLRREYLDTTTLPPNVRADVLRHCVSVFLLRAAEVARRTAAQTNTGTSIFPLFRDQVERNYSHTRSVSDYANMLGYSRRTLVRVVQSAAGQTPKAFIDNRVVLEAKRLLVHTNTPVCRIGAMLGFADAANFTKYFQQHSGTTPTDFRESEGRV